MGKLLKRFSVLTLSVALLFSDNAINVLASEVQADYSKTIDSVIIEQMPADDEKTIDEIVSTPVAEDETSLLEEQDYSDDNITNTFKEDTDVDDESENEIIQSEEEIEDETEEVIAQEPLLGSDAVFSKLESLKSEFPAGKYWNHYVNYIDDAANNLGFNNKFAYSLTDYPCDYHDDEKRTGVYDCNAFGGGIQCFGFANLIYYKVFSEYPQIYSNKIEGNSNISIGDFVRLNNDTHSGVVYSIDGDSFTMVECNYGLNSTDRCKITWGENTYNKNAITYYVHSANYNKVTSVGNVTPSDNETREPEFRYTLGEGNKATITGFSNNWKGHDLVIPEYVDGYEVVGIGAGAFKDHFSLYSVIIPNNVKKINSNAFLNCESLSQVRLPEKLELLGEYAFGNCKSIGNIVIPKEISSCTGPFIGCEGLKSVSFIDGIEYIPTKLFYRCAGIEEINIPNTVTAIYASAFEDAKNLEKIDMPSSVTIINSKAFYGCYNLSDVVLPSNLTTIGVDAFKNCSAIETIFIPNSLTTVGSESPVADGNGAFENCSKLTTAVFENGIEKIPANIFSKCTSIRNISIPDSVKTIEAYAFYKTELNEIYFPEKLEIIGKYAFYGCNYISDINLPDSVVRIGSLAFGRCDALSEVILPEELDYLGEEVFFGCDLLKKVKISKLISSMGGHPFKMCDGLKEVSFYEGIETIPSELFAGCLGLEEIVLPNTITNINYGAFLGATYLKNITFSNNITEIGKDAFKNCVSLININLPPNLSILGTDAFYGCTSLEKIFIPKTLSKVGDINYTGTIHYGAFAECTSLKSAIFEDGMTTIPMNMFIDCNALKEVKIPQSVKIIGGYAFNRTGIETIELPDELNSIGNTAFCAASSLQSVVIPEHVTSIGKDAFFCCTALTKIEMSNSVTSIGENAFANCEALTEVVLSDALLNISKSLFANDYSLKKVNIPKDCVYIYNGAFSKCEMLEEITFPTSIIRIYGNAFNNSGLKKIDLCNCKKLTLIDEYAFSNCENLEIIQLTECDGLTEINQYAFSKCDKLINVYLPDNLETIGMNCFYDCDAIESITVPNSVTSIGKYSFSGCEKLKEVNLGTGITTIPSYCFQSCPAIESIVIPRRATRINDYAFTTCTGLKTVTIPKSVVTFGNNIFSYPSSMTIMGIEGSAAETYANSNGITFKAINEPATSVELDQTEITVIYKYNDKIKLNETICPQNFTDDVEWKSTNTAVATVSDTGLVTLKGVGTAKIKILVGEELEAVCVLNVLQPVTSISVSPSRFTSVGGEKKQLVATVKPTNANDTSYKWSSSDENVVKVSDTGEITTLKKGTAYVYATALDGSGVKGYCEVTVTSTVNIVDDWHLLESEHNYPASSYEKWKYTSEGAEKLKVTFSAETYTEEDADFITLLDGAGKQIGKYTGEQLASKTITISGDTIVILLESDASRNRYGFKVQNLEVVAEEIELQSISLAKNEIVIKNGATTELPGIEYVPANATVEGEPVWTSEDTSIVSIVNGSLVANKAGVTNISVAVDGKIATCKVVVTEVLNGISLNKEDARLHKGESIIVKYDYSPTNALPDAELVINNMDSNVVDIQHTEELKQITIIAKNAGESTISISVDGFESSINISVDNQITLDYGYERNEGRLYKVNAEYNKCIEILGQVPEREDYIFLGWFTEENANGKKYDSLTKLESGVWTLYAAWADKTQGLSVLPLEKVDYSGKPVKPEVVVYDGNTVLTEKVDYTVSYTNNVKAYTLSEGDEGFDSKLAPTITITGKGNYTNKEKIYFTINPIDIDEEASAEDIYIKANGKLQKPKPVITYNGKAIPTTEYNYFYYETDEYGNIVGEVLSGVKDPGKYAIVITCNGNYVGSKTVNLNVLGEEKLVSKLTIASIGVQQYTGTEIEPNIVVKDGKTPLVENTHYSVKYVNNIEVGTATVIITGIDNQYVGVKKTTFKIIGTPISKASLDGIAPSVIYTGNDITFDDINVYIKATRTTDKIDLYEDVDYHISYLKNLKVGTGTVVVTGINGYTGTLKKTFKITPYKLEDSPERIDVILDEEIVEHCKGGAKPRVTVQFTTGEGVDEVLTEKVDYTISYSNIGSINDWSNEKKIPTVKVVLKGNYKGTVLKYFKISTKDIGLTDVVVNDKVYQNKKGAYISSVALYDTDGKKLTANADYVKVVSYKYKNATTIMSNGVIVTRAANSIVEPYDIVPAGTIIIVTVTAKEGGNYTGTVSGEYRVTQKSISSAKVSIPAQIYTGTEIRPTAEMFTVKVGNEPELRAGFDYEIVPGTYKNNIKKGTASVTIRGRDNYGGTKVVNFKITAKGFTWWWR